MRATDITPEDADSQTNVAAALLERKIPAETVPAGTEMRVDGELYRVVRQGVATEFVLALAAIALTSCLIGALQTLLWAAPFLLSKLLFALASAAIGIVLVVTIAQRPMLGKRKWAHASVVGSPVGRASATENLEASAHTA
ncbi:hypothetical protein F8O06_05300 [Pseudoclavibacter sp. CFCC 14310]|uniref:hypothetical protein n=1 Tax=Pseudoclavibacter sp. CFCC 14310 TaxID=2615180 RepID=UPI001301043F|nr:hypothetical protein [Pseudoclavibacter sp. CFCC 14310]KAB1646182.1 hypothetical protein F8O06_05300 [Pseudoclavibacter sp. CFCC 14310]